MLIITIFIINHFKNKNSIIILNSIETYKIIEITLEIKFNKKVLYFIKEITNFY